MKLARGWFGSLGLGAWMFVACGGNDPLGQFEAPADAGGRSQPDASPTDPDAAADASADSLEARAGTRLEPRYYEVRGADGSLTRQFVNWFDRDLGADCRTAKASDGLLRCVPSAETPAQGFSDAACTQPVLVVERSPCSTARPLRPYLFLPPPTADACAAGELVSYPRDTPLPLGTYYVQQGATCEAQILRDGSLAFDRNAVQPVAAAQLVAMQQSEVVTASGSRLQNVAVHATGEDGSSVVTDDQVLDTTRGEYCSAKPLGEAGHVCAPRAAPRSVVGYSADSCAAGTELLGGVVLPYACYQADPRLPYGKYLQNAQDDACARVDLYDTPTTPAYAGPLFAGSAAACAASTLDARTHVWPASSYGAPLAASTFVAVDATSEPAVDSAEAHSGTTLRATRVISRFADGLVVSAAPQLVGADGLPCFGQRLEDGNEYCLHGAVALTQSPPRFADAACTDPVVHAPYFASGCGAPEGATYLLDQDYAVDACKPQHSYRVVGAPVTTPLFEKNETDACVPSAPLSNESAYRKSELEPFDATTWPRVVVTESAP